MCLRTSTTLYLGVSNRIHCIYFDPTWSKSKRKNNANIKCFLFFFFCLAKCGTPYKSGVSFKLHVCTCCARCKRRTYSVGMVFVFFFLIIIAQCVVAFVFPFLLSKPCSDSSSSSSSETQLVNAVKIHTDHEVLYECAYH